MQDFEILEQEEGAEVDAWAIDNDHKAEWALKKIRQSEEEFKRIEALANDEIKELEDAKEAARKKYEDRIKGLKSMLWQYFDTLPAEAIANTKTESKYALLTGKLVKKKEKQQFTCDKATTLQYCKANNMPEFVKVKTEESLDWAGLKKELAFNDDGVVVLASTGEVIEGVASELVPASFDIKFN